MRGICLNVRYFVELCGVQTVQVVTVIVSLRFKLTLVWKGCQ